jgi:hypothetical protein
MVLATEILIPISCFLISYCPDIVGSRHKYSTYHRERVRKLERKECSNSF